MYESKFWGNLPAQFLTKLNLKFFNNEEPAMFQKVKNVSQKSKS